VYLLADRLQDLESADLIIDEFKHFVIVESVAPEVQISRLVYESTVHGHPFRKLMRDCFRLQDTRQGLHGCVPQRVAFGAHKRCNGGVPETDDAVISVGRIADFKDAYRYHQHSKKQPCYISGAQKYPLVLPSAGNRANDPVDV
jgi:hypothetical protein